MRIIRDLLAIATLAGVLAGGSGGCATTKSLLDGQEKSFLIVGYSTSYAWPQMLQDMLDEQTGGKRTYHVLNAVVGGSPVETWTAEPGTKDYDATIGAMLRDYIGPNARLRGQAPTPTIALCQQSLQFTRTLRGPIASADDREGIRIGADAFEKLAQRLHSHGIKDVYIATHIYKKPIEPEVGNEKLALKAMLARGLSYTHAGPDVWTPTKKEYPKAYAEDGLHPNERGMKLMAAAWYRRLAGPDARPAIIKHMFDQNYDINTMMRTYIASRRNGTHTAQGGTKISPEKHARSKSIHGAKRRAAANSLKVGQMAPDFTLKRLHDEDHTVSLAAFRGKRPVVLFFGSYT